MILAYKISDIKNFLQAQKAAGKRIGFVPTMGALHQGHLSLIEASKRENDITVCSIFVNPEQFNNKEDLAKYPKDLDADAKMLESLGCDAVFCPADREMYLKKPRIKISFGKLEEVMEGIYRKDHFNGVAIIVAKLFHIINPDTAYFGQKDLQQFRIIACLVDDLSFPIVLKDMPIIRETNGLAMSSRNSRLSKEEKIQAGVFYQSLKKAQKALLEGVSVAQVKNSITQDFKLTPFAQLEYFNIVNRLDLQEVKQIENPKDVALCIAGYVGNVRLIDNMYLIS